jgi:hypothetical protein
MQHQASAPQRRIADSNLIHPQNDSRPRLAHPWHIVHAETEACQAARVHLQLVRICLSVRLSVCLLLCPPGKAQLILHRSVCLQLHAIAAATAARASLCRLRGRPSLQSLQLAAEKGPRQKKLVADIHVQKLYEAIR